MRINEILDTMPAAPKPVYSRKLKAWTCDTCGWGALKKELATHELKECLRNIRMSAGHELEELKSSLVIGIVKALDMGCGRCRHSARYHGMLRECGLDYPRGRGKKRKRVRCRCKRFELPFMSLGMP